jgi:hypothetical protein
MRKRLMRFAVGVGVAGALGASLGIGAATANATPSSAVRAGFAQWGPGPTAALHQRAAGVRQRLLLGFYNYAGIC